MRRVGERERDKIYHFGGQKSATKFIEDKA